MCRPNLIRITRWRSVIWLFSRPNKIWESFWKTDQILSRLLFNRAMRGLCKIIRALSFDLNHFTFSAVTFINVYICSRFFSSYKSFICYCVILPLLNSQNFAQRIIPHKQYRAWIQTKIFNYIMISVSNMRTNRLSIRKHITVWKRKESVYSLTKKMYLLLICQCQLMM